MDFNKLNSITESLSRDDLSQSVRENLEIQLQDQALAFVDSLVNFRMVEHVVVACKLLFSLDYRFQSAISTASALSMVKKLIRLLSDPRLVTPTSNSQSFDQEIVVKLILTLLTNHVSPDHIELPHRFIIDTCLLISDSIRVYQTMERVMIAETNRSLQPPDSIASTITMDVSIQAYELFLREYQILDSDDKSIQQHQETVSIHLSSIQKLQAVLCGSSSLLLQSLPSIDLNFIGITIWETVLTAIDFLSNSIWLQTSPDFSIQQILLCRSLITAAKLCEKSINCPNHLLSNAVSCLVNLALIQISSFAENSTERQVVAIPTILHNIDSKYHMKYVAESAALVGKCLTYLRNMEPFGMEVFPEDILYILRIKCSFSSSNHVNNIGTSYTKSANNVQQQRLISVLLELFHSRLTRLSNIADDYLFKLFHDIIYFTRFEETSRSASHILLWIFHALPMSPNLINPPRHSREAALTSYLTTITEELTIIASSSSSMVQQASQNPNHNIESTCSSLSLLKMLIDLLDKSSSSNNTPNIKSAKSTSQQNLIPEKINTFEALQIALNRVVSTDLLSNYIYPLIRSLCQVFEKDLSSHKTEILPHAIQFLTILISFISMLPPREYPINYSTSGAIYRILQMPFQLETSTPNPISRPSFFGEPPKVFFWKTDSDEMCQFIDLCLCLMNMESSWSNGDSFMRPMTDARPRVVAAGLRHFPMRILRIASNLQQPISSAVSDIISLAIVLIRKYGKVASAISAGDPSDSLSTSTIVMWPKLIHSLLSLQSIDFMEYGQSVWVGVKVVQSKTFEGDSQFSLIPISNGNINDGNDNISNGIASNVMFWTIDRSNIMRLKSIVIDWNHNEELGPPSLTSTSNSSESTSSTSSQLPLLFRIAYIHAEHYHVRYRLMHLSPNTSSSIIDESRMDASITDMSVNSATSLSDQHSVFGFVFKHISSLFGLLLNDPHPEMRSCCRTLIVDLIERNSSSKNSSRINDHIAEELEQFASNSLQKNSSKATHISNNNAHNHEEDNSMIYNLIDTLGCTGAAFSGWYVLPPLLRLLNFLGESQVSIKSRAYQNIHFIATSHNMEPKQLLQSYEPKVGVHLAGSMKVRPHLIDQVCSAILDIDSVTYLKKSLRFMLPKIIISCDIELLKLVSRRTGEDTIKLVLDTMNPILAKLIAKANPSIDALKFLVEVSGISVVEIFNRWQSGVLFEVVMMLGEDSKKGRVTNSLDFLLRTLSMAQSSSHLNQGSNRRGGTGSSGGSHSALDLFSSKRPLVTHGEYLASNFLMISNYLLYKVIMEPKSTKALKLCAINSFRDLIKMIGNQIEKYYVIISSVLKHALTSCPEHAKAICDAWITFIKLLPEAQLGAVFGPTSLFLFGNLKTDEENIVQVLEYMFIQRKSVSSQFYKNVPVIQEGIPSLARIYAEWKQITDTGNSSGDLKLQLTRLLILARNDDSSIRKLSLDQLISFLKIHRSKLVRFALLENHSDSTLIGDLVQTLLDGCKDSISELSIRFAWAFGCIGALDPNVLHLPSPNNNSISSNNNNIHSSTSGTLQKLVLNDEQFALELIENYLVKSYKTATNMEIQDQSCFIIQELLSYFGCNGSTPLKTISSVSISSASSTSTSTLKYDSNFTSNPSINSNVNSDISKGVSIWSKFSPDTRCLISPFLSSQWDYDRKSIAIPSSQLDSKKQFQTCYQPKMAYNSWMSQWLRRLIVDSKSQLYNTFMTLSPYHNLEASHFVLPYVVLTILQQGSLAAKNAVLLEFLAVLGAIHPNHPLLSSISTHLNADMIFMDIDGNQHHSIDNDLMTMDRKSQASSSIPNLDAVNTLAAQRIFALIDSLSQYVEVKRREAIKSSSLSNHGNKKQPRTDSEDSSSSAIPIAVKPYDPLVTPIEEFLSKIPYPVLSKVAVHCLGYARGLKYFESSLMASRNSSQRTGTIETTNNNLNMVEGIDNNHNNSQQQNRPHAVSIANPASSSSFANFIDDPSEIVLLQQIYSNIDDPDALLGLVNIKTRSGVDDLISEYKGLGKWSDALVALEQAVKNTKGDMTKMRKLQVERLECLSELGLFSQMLNLASSCISDSNESSNESHLQKLRAFAVSAAWKLGDWKYTEQLLQDYASTGTNITGLQSNSPERSTVPFDIGIGRLLVALRHKNYSEFSNVLRELCLSLKQPLQAASLESYERSYPIIVKYQMLTELYDSWTLLYGSDDSPIPQSLFAPNHHNSSTSRRMTSLNAIHDLEPASVVLGNGIARPSTPLLNSTTSNNINNNNNMMDVDPPQQDLSSSQATINVSEKTMASRRTIVSDWDQRFLAMNASFKAKEPILSLRIAIFGLADMNNEAAASWLHLAKAARVSGRTQMAQYALMKVRERDEMTANLQMAKLQWSNFDRSGALVEVLKLIDPNKTQSLFASKSLILGHLSGQQINQQYQLTGDAVRNRLVTGGANSTPKAAGTSSLSRANSGVSGILTRQTVSIQNNKNVSSSSSSMITRQREGNNSLQHSGFQNIVSKAHLLAARWMQECNYCVSAIRDQYKKTKVETSAKSLYYHGTFMDNLCMELKRSIMSQNPMSKDVKTSSKRSSSSAFGGGTSGGGSNSNASSAANIPSMLTPASLQYWDNLPVTIHSFYSSLRVSQKYCFEILPRMVCIWFELADAIQDLYVPYPKEFLMDITAKPTRKTSTPSSSSASTTNTNNNSAHHANFPPTVATKKDEYIIKVPFASNSDDAAQGIIHCFRDITDCMLQLYKRLPPYVWLICLPLLISGCVSKNKDVENLISKIILLVIQHHPQQAVWHLLPLRNSPNQDRQSKYHYIKQQCNQLKSSDPSFNLPVFVNDAVNLAAEITTLCLFKFSKDKSSTNTFVTLDSLCQVSQYIPKELIVPTEHQLSSAQFFDASKDPTNPFAFKPVFIRSFHPHVEVFKSLAKPRKLIIYGSDEKEYWFLCKPVDDLRKDAGMMDFSGMVNKILKRDVESRKRQLRVRTYSVLPLSDRSGLLGWVPNTQSLREIIGNMYSMELKDLTQMIRDAKPIYDKNQANKDKFENIWISDILSKFPIVLGKWFLQNFTDPSHWLRARTNYTRTAAVMSIVGTFLGLGDRHCENILLDSQNGDCIHVDLNCMFFKGLSFNIPECVPFRLTRNMVDAFGISGFEGCFRKSCEHTMRVMRRHKHALISVLGTFLHDPLLEWDSGATTTRQKSENIHYSHERKNRTAMEILNGISDRLDGLNRTPLHKDQVLITLSVEGYVDAIIKEATSTENLSQMYIGWSPFL